MAFLAFWGVAAVVLVIVLFLAPTSTPSLAAFVPPSFAGSYIPPGTNFTFLFSEAILMYTENLTGSPGSLPVEVRIAGNWTASAPTWVRANYGSTGAPTCLIPFGCSDGIPTGSGSLDLLTAIPTNSESDPGYRSVSLYLEFWSSGSDRVTVTSPTAAAVLP